VTFGAAFFFGVLFVFFVFFVNLVFFGGGARFVFGVGLKAAATFARATRWSFLSVAARPGVFGARVSCAASFVTCASVARSFGVFVRFGVVFVGDGARFVGVVFFVGGARFVGFGFVFGFTLPAGVGLRVVRRLATAGVRFFF